MLRLEQLDVYRLSRELAVTIYRATKQEPMCREFGLADQIRRSAISVPSNIAEAVALGTKAQMVRGLRIALGSSVELRTQIWIAVRVDALEEPLAATMDRELDRVVGMLVGLLKRLGATVPRTPR